MPSIGSIGSLEDLRSLAPGVEVLFGRALYIPNSTGAWEEDARGILLSSEALWDAANERKITLLRA